VTGKCGKRLNLVRVIGNKEKGGVGSSFKRGENQAVVSLSSYSLGTMSGIGKATQTRSDDITYLHKKEREREEPPTLGFYSSRLGLTDPSFLRKK